MMTCVDFCKSLVWKTEATSSIKNEQQTFLFLFSTKQLEFNWETKFFQTVQQVVG